MVQANRFLFPTIKTTFLCSHLPVCFLSLLAIKTFDELTQIKHYMRLRI